MKYTVTLIVDASIQDDVEADSAQDAIDKVYRVGANFCHQCSEKIQGGDIIASVVEDETGATVHDDTLEAQLREENEELNKKVAELEKKLKSVAIGYSRTKKKAN